MFICFLDGLQDTTTRVSLYVLMSLKRVCVCVHVSGFVRDVCLLAARVTQLVHPCDSERAGGTRGSTQVMSGAGVPWVNTLGYKWYLFTISVIKISDSI